MQNTKPHTPTEKFYLEKKPFEKILMIIGCVCFITSCVFALVYSGFTSQPQYEVKYKIIADEQTLWLLSAGLGVLGGALINIRKLFASIPAGLVANLFMTGFTLFYISFRESILSYEILLPLFLGSVLGSLIYNFLDGRIYKNKINPELKN